MTEAASSVGGDRSARARLLGTPGKIGPMRLKNRIIMGPMGTNYGTTDGLSTDRDKRYYAERARGGVAMIVTEAMNISDGARNHNNSLCIFHDRFIPGLAAIVEAIAENGAYAVAQLNHRGQLLRRSVLGMEPVGPSAGTHPATGEPVRSLERAEIRAIQKHFVEAAGRVQRAGYHACEIHAANGYLFQQFFSERFNKRTDEYGGSLENRMRLLLETVDMIGGACPDLPLMVRISATEFAPGGYSQDEAIELALTLQSAGVIALDLSGGSNEHPSLSRYCIQPPSFPRRCLEPYAKPFTEALDMPVIVAGRIIEADDAEAVLASNSADFVSVARGLIADPHWAGKALGEIDAPIRRCISCNVCYERLTLERDVSCVANPFVGTEFEQLEYLEPQLFAGQMRAAEARSVLVLGAGVAGVEAARMARALGHQVEIWEHSERAGGQLDLALSAPDKEDVEGVWTYRKASLDALGITVRTGMTVSADAIRDHGVDLVVVATGARPRALPFAMDFGAAIHQAWSVLRQPELIAKGSHVTLIGGGLVGIEAADLLVERGCEVVIVELRDVIAPEMARNNRYEIVQRLKEAGTPIYTGTTISGVDGDEIIVTAREGEARIPVGDAVVVAVGSQPNHDVMPAVIASGVRHVLVGDCNKPGDFMTAIRDAAMVALTVGEPKRQPSPPKTHVAVAG